MRYESYYQKKDTDQVADKKNLVSIFCLYRLLLKIFFHFFVTVLVGLIPAKI